MLMDDPRLDALERASRHAPFLAGLIRRHGDLVDAFLAHGAAPLIAADKSEANATPGPVPVDLRLRRQRLALAVALGDLAGELTLERVTAALSDFADAALDTALSWCSEKIAGSPSRDGFAVIALGKLGSRELNYSSDIDLILIYDPDRVPRRARDEPAQGAQRLARELVDVIGAQTEHGRVFRVDLRLRPTPDITPIALPVDAAISHYESQALAWERAAFIRARAAAGDARLGGDFLATIQPFIWRRALDFGQIRAIGDVSSRIRDHYASGQAFGPGYDLKRGRGGIREVEFLAQTHQLIHGGRQPALRQPATVPALDALAGAGIVSRDEADVLANGYRLLRTIEHRVQMIDDRQTHSLPHRAAALDRVARLHGIEDGDGLIAALAEPVEAIGTIYDRLIEPDDYRRLPAAPATLADHFDDAGFADIDKARRIVESWRSGRYPSLRSRAAQDALETMLDDIVGRLAEAPDPDAALLGLDAVLAKVPSSLNLFRLLDARPRVLEVLTDILSFAPALAHDLGKRSDLLDGLIDRHVAGDRLAPQELAARLAWAAGAPDYETVLDRVRAVVGEYRFATGTRLIDGCDPIDAAHDYAAIAEQAVRLLADTAIAEHRRAHGLIADSELAILALGRFGGGALTHASDLDLIFLFTGTFSAQSDGPRPLGATRYYNRLAQRIIAALSVPTATGGLYDVDVRLRPSGEQGPLSVSVDSFLDYQSGNAWTWEHMSLTRARTVYGSDAARDAIDSAIHAILSRPRDRATLIADAVKMRRDIAAAKPPRGPFDAKLVPGGLVDLEFAVHVTQLAERRGLDPDLQAAVQALAQAGLAPADMPRAHDFLTRLLVTLRLVAPGLIAPNAARRTLIARACRVDDWDTLVAQYRAARQLVADWWAEVGETEAAKIEGD